MKLRFAHISDTHITPSGKMPYTDDVPDLVPLIDAINGLPYSSLDTARRLVAEINSLPFPIDFVLHTGDVMHEPDTDEAYETAREILTGLKYPVHYLAGNHDRAGGLQRVLARRADVAAPLDYTFEAQGVQVVCLDSSANGEHGAGYLSDQQFDWLAQVCAGPSDLPVIVALHHNPLPFGATIADRLGLLNGEALHEALLPLGRRLRGVFYGHIHQGVDTYRDGILYSAVVGAFFQFDLWPGVAVAGGIDALTPPGFNIVTLTDATTYVRRCSYRMA